jgi:cytoskeletal protein CcmA (bactofilin family)
VLRGEVDFAGGLRIEGEVNGDISVSPDAVGTLMVGEKGVVNGDVRVSHLVVYGSITGTIHVTDLIELRPTAVILGDVYYGAIEMQMGAVIEGNLVHLAADSSSASKATNPSKFISHTYPPAVTAKTPIPATLIPVPEGSQKRAKG